MSLINSALERLLKARPEGTELSQVDVAYNRLMEQVTAHAAEAEQLRQRRGALLLDGSADQIEKAEADLAEAEKGAERARIALEELKGRRAIAARKAAEQGLLAEVAALDAESVEIARLIADVYPGLARKIAEIAARELAFENTAEELFDRILKAKGEGIVPSDIRRVPTPAERVWKNDFMPVHSIAARLILPHAEGVEGDQHPYWPPAASGWGRG